MPNDGNTSLDDCLQIVADLKQPDLRRCLDVRKAVFQCPGNTEDISRALKNLHEFERALVLELPEPIVEERRAEALSAIEALSGGNHPRHAGGAHYPDRN